MMKANKLKIDKIKTEKYNFKSLLVVYVNVGNISSQKEIDDYIKKISKTLTKLEIEKITKSKFIIVPSLKDETHIEFITPQPNTDYNYSKFKKMAKQNSDLVKELLNQYNQKL